MDSTGQREAQGLGAAGQVGATGQVEETWESVLAEILAAASLLIAGEAPSEPVQPAGAVAGVVIPVEAENQEENAAGQELPPQQAMAVLPEAEGPQNVQERPRPTRIMLTPMQLRELEAVFQRIQYPDGLTIDRIAEFLGLTRKKVQVWFQNRRAKVRRLHREMQRNMAPVPVGLPPGLFFNNPYNPAHFPPPGRRYFPRMQHPYMMPPPPMPPPYPVPPMYPWMPLPLRPPMPFFWQGIPRYNAHHAGHRF